MKNKWFMILAVALVGLLLAGCSSTTYVNTMTLEGADIDMSKCRNVALTSTAQFSGTFGSSGDVKWSTDGGIFPIAHYNVSGLPVDLASYINKALVTQVQNTGYFTKVIAPPESDIFNSSTLASIGVSRDELIAKNNVDAIIETSIIDMKFDEYVTSKAVYKTKTYTDKNGKKTSKSEFDHWDYTLTQTLGIELELKIQDTKTNSTMATRRFADTLKKTYELAHGTSTSNSPRDGYINMLNKMANTIATKMVPHYVYQPQPVMNNKPHLATVDAAYSMLSRNQADSALYMFKEGWTNNKHVPSGYNAALILHGQGKIDEAIELMKEVYAKSGNKAAGQMLSVMMASQSIWKYAQTQVDNKAH